jgi:hypothetical protein
MACDPPRQRSRTKAASDKRMRSNVNVPHQEANEISGADNNAAEFW